jgi:hypothetical protein
MQAIPFHRAEGTRPEIGFLDAPVAVGRHQSISAKAETIPPSIPPRPGMSSTRRDKPAGTAFSRSAAVPVSVHPAFSFRPSISRPRAAFRFGGAKPVAALGKQKSRFHTIELMISNA